MEEWIQYLKTGTIEANTKAPGLEEAREKLKYYNMTSGERHAYDEHINAIMIQNDVLESAKLEGREEGCEEGERRKQLEIACKMKALGVPAEIITEATGLTSNQIAEL